jgi:hypothetical protein
VANLTYCNVSFNFATAISEFVVFYRFFTPPLAGIGKLLALFGQYFSIGITILPKSHN